MSGCKPDRPYAAYKGVAVLKEATWAQDAETENWYLVEATWEFKTGLTDEDIVYQYREGYLITPGRFEEILRKLDEK